MTDTNLRTNGRAVVIAAMVVLSMMVGTIALAEMAAASTTSMDLSDDLVQGGEEVTVSGTVNANGTVYAFIDTNGDGVYNSTEPSATVDISDFESDNKYSLDLNAPGTSGTYEVYVNQTDSTGQTITEGWGGERSASLQVDAKKPNFGDGHNRQVTTTTPTITVPLTDANSSVNASTIEVDVTNGDKVIHQVNAPSSDSDGISYSASDGEVTVDFSSSGLEALTDGEYDFTIRAEDAAGNPNSTSFKVNVDTGEPTFTLNAPSSALVKDTTQEIDVSVVGSDINTSTVELTVEGPNGYSVTNNSSSDIWTGSKFEFVPGTNGVPELPDGTITMSVTATDNYGNANSTAYTFEVDNQKPHVDGVSVNETLYTDDNAVVEVTVDFNESVSTDSVEATISAGETTETLTDFGQGTDDGASTVVATYDLIDGATSFDGIQNGSVEVLATAGQDVAGNSANLTVGSNSTTFAVDTVEPKVNIKAGLPDPLPQRVDIEQYVTVSQANGNEAKIGWQVGDGDVTWFDNAASVDTRNIVEGNVDIVAMATDENGTTKRTEVSRVVNNFDVGVSYTGPDVLTGTESDTTYNVSDLVSVEHNGTFDVTGYDVYKLGAEEDLSDVEASDFSFDDDDSFIVNSDATYVFAVEVDGTTHMTSTAMANVFEEGDLSLSAERDATADGGTFNVTVTSKTQLSALNVTVGSVDFYQSQYHETLSIDQFTETNVSNGGWEYTLTFDTERDGRHALLINNATTVNGLSIGQKGFDYKTNPTNFGDDGVEAIAADASAPSLVDADVVGTDNGHTQVKLTFSEPLADDQLTTDELTFTGQASVLGVTPGTGNAAKDGVYTVTFDSEIQTGGDVALEISEGAYAERFNDSTTNAKDSMAVDSIELGLQKGANYVSVPIETGEVSLDSLDLSGVASIWAYDNGGWTNFNPSAEENDLTALEGGQGYILYADSQTTLDVRGYTLYETGSSGAPNLPASEGIETGWNLIGHFQEGSQSVSHALTNVAQVPEVGVIGQNVNNASTLQPGEAYWVFVESSDLYPPVNYQSQGDDIAPSFNSANAVEANVDQADSVVSSAEDIEVTADVDDAATVHVDASSVGAGTQELTLNGGTWSATFAPSDGLEGTKDLTVVATDADGIETTKVVSITVDTINSTVSKTSSFPSDDVTGTPDVTTWFSITDSDGGSTTYEYKAVGGDTWTEIGSETTWTLPSDGDYVVRATDTDDVGNSDSADGTITVDNTSPTSSIQSYSFDTSTDTVTVQFSENVTNVEKSDFSVNLNKDQNSDYGTAGTISGSVQTTDTSDGTEVTITLGTDHTKSDVNGVQVLEASGADIQDDAGNEWGGSGDTDGGATATVQ